MYIILENVWQNWVHTNNDSSHIIVVSNESSESILSICVNFSDDNKQQLKKYIVLKRICIGGWVGRVFKMAVICQRVVILLQLCADMIAKIPCIWYLI